MATKPIVGYWDIRGRGEPIRLLLKYAGVEFTDKRYKMEANSEWSKEKTTLGFDFPNLPYLIEGELKLTQSLAILGYLSRKYGLAGSGETAQNRVAILEQQVADYGLGLMKYFHRKDPLTEEEKTELRKALQGQFEALSKFLARNKFVAGEEVTYGDFWLYEYVKKVAGVESVKGELGAFPVLVEYLKSIEELPQLKEYLAKINAK